MTRKLTILLILLLFAFCIYSAAHFFTAGYAETLDPSYNYIEGKPVVDGSPQQITQCTEKQQTAKRLIEPLFQRANSIGTYLGTGQLPINNGQALYNQYMNLENQIWSIQNKYACT